MLNRDADQQAYYLSRIAPIQRGKRGFLMPLKCHFGRRFLTFYDDPYRSGSGMPLNG